MWLFSLPSFECKKIDSWGFIISIKHKSVSEMQWSSHYAYSGQPMHEALAWDARCGLQVKAVLAFGTKSALFALSFPSPCKQHKSSAHNNTHSFQAHQGGQGANFLNEALGGCYELKIAFAMSRWIGFYPGGNFHNVSCVHLGLLLRLLEKTFGVAILPQQGLVVCFMPSSHFIHVPTLVLCRQLFVHQLVLFFQLLPLVGNEEENGRIRTHWSVRGVVIAVVLLSNLLEHFLIEKVVGSLGANGLAIWHDGWRFGFLVVVLVVVVVLSLLLEGLSPKQEIALESNCYLSFRRRGKNEARRLGESQSVCFGPFCDDCEGEDVPGYRVTTKQDWKIIVFQCYHSCWKIGYPLLDHNFRWQPDNFPLSAAFEVQSQVHLQQLQIRNIMALFVRWFLSLWVFIMLRGYWQNTHKHWPCFRNNKSSNWHFVNAC